MTCQLTLHPPSEADARRTPPGAVQSRPGWSHQRERALFLEPARPLGMVSIIGAVVPGLAALLLDEMDALDADAALDRLHHVVDGEARNGHGSERFHLNTG